MSLQAVKSDFAAYFNDPIAPGDRPKPYTSDPNSPEHLTLFSPLRRWGVLVLDEAHYVRTVSKFHWAATELRHAAAATVAMTATPVMTSPMVSLPFV